MYRLSKRYPQAGGAALSNLNVEIPTGAMGFVTGHSGAGKSTLLKLLAAAERASGGELVVGGEDLCRLDKRERHHYRRRIGVVQQEAQLVPEVSVGANVGLPLRVRHRRPPAIERAVRAALDQVNLLPLYGAAPAHLSDGERQRVGIARAIVGDPELILADEPTGNLDRALARDVMRLFWQINRRNGATVLVASHDDEMVEQMEMPVLRLQNGRVLHNEFLAAEPA